MQRGSRLFAPIAAALLLPLGAVAADTAVKLTPVGKIARDARWCSMPSSSRLQRKDDECAQVKEGARSYSNGELSSTGQLNAVEALKRLDPSVN